MTLPSPLAQYICSYIADQYFPAYLRVDADGTILELGGQLQHYALQTLRSGDTTDDSLNFLTGIIPLENDPIFLPLVKDQQGRSMDVHIFPDQANGDWVLLLDGNTSEEQQLELQQQGNYLALQTHRQKQHLSKLFQTHPSKQDTTDDSHFSALVDVAILNITINPSMGTAAAPMTVIQAIETYFATVTTAIVDRSGVVAAQMGRSILAIFGLVPMPLPPSQQAVETGLEILRQGPSIASPTDPQLSELCMSFEAGAMVTSGASALGLLRASPYQSMGLISPQMPEIIGLTGHIRPRELMIDAQTFRQLTHNQYTFTQSELSFTDSSSMTIYSCHP